MANKHQLGQYCLDHGYTLTQTVTHHWSLPKMSLTLFGDAIIAVVVGVAAYEIGKYGISAVYTWIKSKFNAPTQTVTPVTATPTATA